MKRMLIILSLLWIAQLSGHSHSIDSLFAAAPVEALQLLDRNARLDLLDFYNAQKQAKAENRLGGTTQMTAKTDLCLTLRLTECSTWQMVILPPSDTRTDTLLMCVHTVERPAAESILHFYTKDWQPVATPIEVPSPTMLYARQEGMTDTEWERVRNELSTLPEEAVWLSEEGVLRFSLSTSSLADNEEKEAVMACLRSADVRL